MKFIDKLYFKFRHFFSSRFPVLYNFFEDRKSVFKFIASGSFAGLTDLIFLFIFHGVIGMGLVLSTSLAFVLSFLASFTLQKLWTFRDKRRGRTLRQLGIYFVNAIFDLNLNGFLMHTLVNRIGIWYILAQIIVNLSIGFLNFFVYKLLIFNRNKDENRGK